MLTPLICNNYFSESFFIWNALNVRRKITESGNNSILSLFDIYNWSLSEKSNQNKNVEISLFIYLTLTSNCTLRENNWTIKLCIKKAKQKKKSFCVWMVKMVLTYDRIKLGMVRILKNSYDMNLKLIKKKVES